MDPTLLQFCLLMAAAFVGVIGLAVAVKLAEVYRARDWPQTTGAITKSKVRSHKHRPNDEGYQYASEPLVTYEYTVSG